MACNITCNSAGLLTHLMHLFYLIVLINAKGGRNDDNDIEIYEIEPRNPVIYTKNLERPTVIYNGEAYASLDLQYYSLFYPRYDAFLGTDQHLENRERVITSDKEIKVCTNHDITDGNITLGAFTCPLPFEPAQFDKCCGLQDAEFCCSSKTAGRAAGIAAFFVITFSILVFGGLFYTFAGREVGKRDSSDENHF